MFVSKYMMLIGKQNESIKKICHFRIQKLLGKYTKCWNEIIGEQQPNKVLPPTDLKRHLYRYKVMIKVRDAETNMKIRIKITEI